MFSGMESIITVQDVASADNPHQLEKTSSNAAIYAHVSRYEAPFLSKLYSEMRGIFNDVGNVYCSSWNIRVNHLYI